MKLIISLATRIIPRHYLQHVSHFFLRIFSIFLRGNKFEDPINGKTYRKLLPYGRLKPRENALPILEHYSFNSVVFLIAKNLDDKSGRYIDRKDLKTIINHKNVTLGLHGYSHTDLTSLSYDLLMKELANIKQVC